MTKPGYKRTELGDIPLEWEVKRLGEVMEFINGTSFKASEWATSGFPIIRIQNLNGSNDYNYYKGSIEKMVVVHRGDLLFAWSGSKGTSFGAYIWKHSTAVLNQHIFKVSNISHRVNKDFIFFWLKYATAKIENNSHGSAGLVHITKKELEKYYFPMPKLLEQQCIAAILSSVDDLLESSRRVVEQVREVRRGVMQQLLTRGIPGWHTEFKESKFGKIPCDWKIKTLDEVTRIVTDMDHKMPRTTSHGAILVSVTDFTEYGIDFESAKRISYEDYTRLSRKCKLERGDFLFTRYGTIGEVRIIESKESIIASYSIAMIKPDDEKMYRKFLYFFLKSDIVKDQANLHTVQSAQPDLGLKHIKKIQIFSPPLEEQQRIVTILESFDARIRAETERIKALEGLKKGLMQQLLMGQLRVKLEAEAVT